LNRAADGPPAAGPLQASAERPRVVRHASIAPHPGDDDGLASRATHSPVARGVGESKVNSPTNDASMIYTKSLMYRDQVLNVEQRVTALRAENEALLVLLGPEPYAIAPNRDPAQHNDPRNALRALEQENVRLRARLREREAPSPGRGALFWLMWVGGGIFAVILLAALCLRACVTIN